MDNYKNPWESMEESTQRRVDFDTGHNFLFNYPSCCLV